jgi:hypothetical protein
MPSTSEIAKDLLVANPAWRYGAMRRIQTMIEFERAANRKLGSVEDNRAALEM